ncbi:MAG: transglutaminase-like cysteine peptidase [Robiginitomaculum sp.]|nr:transglutaminase-like cysteine peptidase [Robiginitomaculum sp.]
MAQSFQLLINALPIIFGGLIIASCTDTPGLLLVHPAAIAAQNQFSEISEEQLAETVFSGLSDLCAVEPEHCALSGRRSVSIKDLVIAIQINERVNSELVWEDDWSHFGVEDRWIVPRDGLGDGEDFSLLKRKLMIEAGIPSNALRFVITGNSRDNHHVALVIQTDTGPWFLGNEAPVHPLRPGTIAAAFIQSSND